MRRINVTYCFNYNIFAGFFEVLEPGKVHGQNDALRPRCGPHAPARPTSAVKKHFPKQSTARRGKHQKMRVAKIRAKTIRRRSCAATRCCLHPTTVTAPISCCAAFMPTRRFAVSIAGKTRFGPQPSRSGGMKSPKAMSIPQPHAVARAGAGSGNAQTRRGVFSARAVAGNAACASDLHTCRFQVHCHRLHKQLPGNLFSNFSQQRHHVGAVMYHLLRKYDRNCIGRADRLA